MMLKDFLKKAGILGVSFGLMASPLAFAQTDENSAIDKNQGITADEQPLDPQGSSASTGTDSADDHDLTRDEGDGMTRYQEDGTFNSNEDAADFESTDELPEENHGM